MAKAEEKKKTVITLGEGRVINENVWEKDQFNEQSKPAYKIEMAFDRAVLEEAINTVFNAACENWNIPADQEIILDVDSNRAPDQFDIVTPFLDGNLLAKKREAKGKEGDAYKGKVVCRASTIFNVNGVDAAGGIAVYGPDNKPLLPVQRNQVFPGCYGYMGVALKFYEDEKTGKHGVGFYLEAFQLAHGEDKDRLITASDKSVLFKPVGRPEGAAPSRRTRG